MYIRRIDGNDKDLVKEWLAKLNWRGFDPEFMPSTSFMVMEDNTPICCSYYYTTPEAPIAFMGITVSNPDFKEDKSEYVNSLLKHMLREMKEKQLRVCYYSTDNLSEKFLNRYMKPLGFRFTSGYVGACSLTIQDDVDFLI